MNEQVRQQYTGVYGPYHQGEYPIGAQIGNGHQTGEVIWSYRAPGRGLVYVCDMGTGFPVEVFANDVMEK